MTAILCSDLSFSWPDGARVLSGLTLSIGAGRTGLIGVNGSGKSTLLKLIAGELRPDSGTVRVAGDVGYLPQAITLGTSRTVEDLLGITAARDALHAIEAGQASEDAFAAIGDDWNVEERARAWLDRLGLTGLGPDDRVERLSGGETAGVALAALFLRRPDVLLLDEPTNNLDLDARRRLYDAVTAWAGVMVIVGHDRELLGLVNHVADLSGGDVRMSAGNLAAYEQRLVAEQEAAQRAVTTASAEVRRERREVIDAQVKQATRDRQGRKVAASGSLPRAVVDARKKHAQESAGRSRELHADRLEAARDRQRRLGNGHHHRKRGARGPLAVLAVAHPDECRIRIGRIFDLAAQAAAAHFAHGISSSSVVDANSPSRPRLSGRSAPAPPERPEAGAWARRSIRRGQDGSAAAGRAAATSERPCLRAAPIHRPAQERRRSRPLDIPARRGRDACCW